MSEKFWEKINRTNTLLAIIASIIAIFGGIYGILPLFYDENKPQKSNKIIVEREVNNSDFFILETDIKAFKISSYFLFLKVYEDYYLEVKAVFVNKNNIDMDKCTGFLRAMTDRKWRSSQWLFEGGMRRIKWPDRFGKTLFPFKLGNRHSKEVFLTSDDYSEFAKPERMQIRLICHAPDTFHTPWKDIEIINLPDDHKGFPEYPRG